jgi:hypothetical protein
LRLFKLFSEKWRLFSFMWDILKDFEAILKCFQRSEEVGEEFGI